MSSSMGTRFVVTTFGESHGACVGAVIDGCPACLALCEQDIQVQLDRRRPGQSDLSTPRKERDRVRLLSGVQNGVTLGTPIGLAVDNEDTRPADYAQTDEVPRPSHSDYTYRVKYGIASRSGGGRASARETVARVAAGAVADILLRTRHGVEIVAWVSAVGSIDTQVDSDAVSRADVDRTVVRCPDKIVAPAMEDLIRQTAAEGDSLGGIVTCVCRRVPAGWGEPVFGKIEAELARAMLSIPAAKAFEIGSGFAGTRLRGSEHNDLFVMKGDRLGTVTNRSGGVQAGITNGEPIVFRVGFKPTATIKRAQATVDYQGRPVVLENQGRHDPCVLPRAVPIVESMAALVLADMALMGGR